MSQNFDLTVELEGLPPAKGVQAPLSATHRHINRTRSLLQAVRWLLPFGFTPLSTSVGLQLTLRTPSARLAWDATNYLGGIADVLQRKSRLELAHLGELATVAVYENDRLIREVRYQHERSDRVGYRLRIWALDRPELEDAIALNQMDVSVQPRRARSPELCIDFVNTFVRFGTEELATYEDLLRWAAENAIVTAETIELLRLTGSLRASEVERLMSAARRFREAIRKVLVAEPSVEDLDEVTTFLQRYMPLQSFRWLDGGAQWVWPDRIDLERVLWPVAQSVLTTLTTNRRDRIRACGSCKQLFVDTSRNNSRRWCQMESCGNRVKGRAFQLRSRNESTAGSSPSASYAEAVTPESAGMMRSP
jgi:predicted RNA-binding Zn ribbon-like protein